MLESRKTESGYPDGKERRYREPECGKMERKAAWIWKWKRREKQMENGGLLSGMEQTASGVRERTTVGEADGMGRRGLPDDCVPPHCLYKEVVAKLNRKRRYPVLSWFCFW